jgi:quercetin dioxygenase-like cupin family protein
VQVATEVEQIMYYLDLSTRKVKELVPNGRAQTFWGEQMLAARLNFDAHARVPEHKHPHEQFGVVLSGELTLTIAGEPLVLHAGEMYLIPGNVPHSAVAGPEGFTAVEVFSPVREDLQYE